VRALLATLLVLLAACGSDPRSPAIEEVTVEPNPLNVLSQRVNVRVRGASTLHAEWSEGGEPRRSPDVEAPPDGEAIVHLLGLFPSTSYEVVVEAKGQAGTVARSSPVSFETGALPSAVAGLSLEVTGAPPAGLVLINAASLTSPGVLVAYDGAGVLRWYRLFEGPLPVVEAKQLPSGHVLAFLGATLGWQPVMGSFVEVAPSGEILRTFTAAPPLFTDSHEGLLTDEGTPAERVHLFGYDSRTVDLAPLGLEGTGDIVGHHLQRLLPSGEPEFTWSAWDHLALDEFINPPFPDQLVGVDFDHPNSLDIDPSGDYLVSFRNLDAVLLIDHRTGEILWRLGGTRSDFDFVDDPLGGFSGQHSARLLENGNVLLFDNGTLHPPPTTRAVEYALDPAAGTARLVWEFRSSAGFNRFSGSTFRDAEGATWVGLSAMGIVDRVGRDGAILWEGRFLLDGQPAPFYRAVPIESLYGQAAP
jgi:hypothetical protein